MIATLIFLVALSVPSYEQDTVPVSISPCPDVFQYEPSPSEESPIEKRWYGVIKVAPRVTIQSVTLHIILDSKADILGNWLGETTSNDNIDFKIDNKSIIIEPGDPTIIRFFVQYSPLALAPKIKIILLNDKEICNADRAQPAIEGIAQSFVDEPVSIEPRPSLTEIMQRWPIKNKHNYDRVVPMTSSNLLSLDSNLNRDGSSQPASSGRQRPEWPNDGYPVNQSPCRSTTETLQVFQSPNIDDDYFDGGPSSIKEPCNSEQRKSNRFPRQDQCGVVALKSIPLVINGTPTMEGQWPWQIALYHSMGINYIYRCGGTLVSLRHVITAAHCVTKMSPGSYQEYNPSTLFVILGKHNLRTSVNGVHRYVSKVTVYPEYNKVLWSTEESTFSRDLAILELREPVTYNDVVRPICLWPENEVDIENVIGQRGSVVGWGVDASGQATEELKLAEIPVVDELTCIKSNEFFRRFVSSYTYCAGSRRGSSVCVGDSGSGMVFQKSGIWYLRGLVSVAVASHEKYRCDPTHYTVFTDLAKFLPWIKQNIYDL